MSGGRQKSFKAWFRMSLPEIFPDTPQARLLARAAARGDIKKMDNLVAEGADVNASSSVGLTIPYWLVHHPNVKGRFIHIVSVVSTF
ncbi:MAG: hypothetical protein ACNI27_06950 [Desulfovibrio sp.]